MSNGFKRHCGFSRHRR